MAIAAHYCQNTQQDLLHGPGRRVVNPINKSKLQGDVKRYRCTACGGEVDKAAVIKGHGK